MRIISKWSGNGQGMVREWSGNGQGMVRKWSGNGQGIKIELKFHMKNC